METKVSRTLVHLIAETIIQDAEGTSDDLGKGQERGEKEKKPWAGMERDFAKMMENGCAKGQQPEK